MTSMSPGLILIFGAIVVPLLRGSVRQVYMLFLPLLALVFSAFLLEAGVHGQLSILSVCLLYTSPSPRDKRQSRMPSSA